MKDCRGGIPPELRSTNANLIMGRKPCLSAWVLGLCGFIVGGSAIANGERAYELNLVCDSALCEDFGGTYPLSALPSFLRVTVNLDQWVLQPDCLDPPSGSGVCDGVSEATANAAQPMLNLQSLRDLLDDYPPGQTFEGPVGPWSLCFVHGGYAVQPPSAIRTLSLLYTKQNPDETLDIRLRCDGTWNARSTLDVEDGSGPIIAGSYTMLEGAPDGNAIPVKAVVLKKSATFKEKNSRSVVRVYVEGPTDMLASSMLLAGVAPRYTRYRDYSGDGVRDSFGGWTMMDLPLSCGKNALALTGMDAVGQSYIGTVRLEYVCR